MKNQSRAIAAFVAFGCVAAVVVGWGVWVNSTPGNSHLVRESSVSRAAKSSAESSPSTSPAPAAAAPATSTSDLSKRPAQQAQVSESDPFLAPNAYIPHGTPAQPEPTRVFAPSTSAITDTPTVKGSQTPKSTIVTSQSEADEPQAEGTAPSTPVESTATQPPATSTPITEVPTTVPAPTPSASQVSPPTLIQPVPTSEVVPTTGPTEPSPILPGGTTTSTPAPAPTQSGMGGTATGASLPLATSTPAPTPIR